jgi:C-terminal processing protease CtpA/Prc
MLIDERALSQSEHSALFFRATGHTRFVGTPTGGANGDVTSMVVPGGVMFHFSGEGVRWPDGKQLQRVGVIPDVRVEPSASDIATGNDVVLQRGLVEALRLSGATATQRNAALRQEISRERLTP